MFELYQAFSSRSTIYPVFKVGLFRNKLLLLAVFSSFTIIAGGIFVPSFGRFLDMARIELPLFMFIVIISSIGAIIIEVSKHLKTRHEAIEMNI